MNFSPEDLLNLVLAAITSWQIKVLFGLIVLDVLLGVASALRRGVFDAKKLANFYGTNVVPFLIGYLAFYVVVGFIIPADRLGEIGEPITEGTVTLAWSTLVFTLLSSIRGNFAELYQSGG